MRIQLKETGRKIFQESTWNTLVQVSNFIEEGANIIISKVSNLSDKSFKIVKDGSEEIVKEGPSTLSSYSKSVTEMGLIGGIGFSAFSQPEIGLGILVGSSKISATLNGIASGLSTIEYIINPSSANAENLTKYIGATLLDLTGGNMINQAAVQTGQIIKETIKTIKYNPYILPFSF